MHQEAVLVDEQRGWLVVHRRCADSFVPNALRLLLDDAVALFTKVQAGSRGIAEIQELARLQRLVGDALNGFVEQASTVQGLLKLVGELWVEPDET